MSIENYIENYQIISDRHSLIQTPNMARIYEDVRMLENI